MSKNSIFEEDIIRNKLAIKGKLFELRKSYFTRKNTTNPNTRIFWDNKIEKSEKVSRLDGMTKDRFKIALSFIPKDIHNVIDIGFGYGDFLVKIKQKRPNIKVFGIDISKVAVKKIKKQIDGVFKVGSVLKIPFQEKFDCIVALEVLEHLRAEKVFKAYKEIHRILDSRGYLIISVPVFEEYSINFNPNQHMRAYTPKLIIEELKLAGFHIVRKKSLSAFSKYYFLKKIIQKLFKEKWKPNTIILLCRKNEYNFPS